MCSYVNLLYEKKMTYCSLNNYTHTHTERQKQIHTDDRCQIDDRRERERYDR